MAKSKDTKRCTKCGEEKHIVKFITKSRNRNGRGSVCKECHNKYNRERRSEEGAISRKKYLDNLIQRWESEGRPQLTKKRCGLCHKIKEIEKFYRNKYKRDGYLYRCIECHKRYVAQRLEKRKAEEKHCPKEITCPKCGEAKRPSQFFRNSVLRTGYATICKQCMRKRQLELHPEEIRVGNEIPCKRCKSPIVVTHGGIRYCDDCTRAKRNKIARRTRRRQVLALSDNYIKKLLVAKTDLSHSDIPKELVEAKRLHLQAARTLRED